MARLWVGDSRTEAMKILFPESTVDHYVSKTGEGYTWFKSKAYSEVEKWLKVGGISEVIFLLGVNDGGNNAPSYVTLVNKLIDDYSTVNFYFCSVNPVAEGYSDHKNFNLKIEDFNKTIKAECKAVYIDSYSYLINHGFKTTTDGLHYLESTTKDIRTFILTKIQSKSDHFSTFRARGDKYTTDSTGKKIYLSQPSWADLNWVNNNYKLTISGKDFYGKNPFAMTGFRADRPGSVLPNCVSYAYGRFMEIIGKTPDTLYIGGNAEVWFPHGAASGAKSKKNPDYDFDMVATAATNADGFLRGTEPQLGAIMCWEGIPTGKETTQYEIDIAEAGHVAIVEYISSDGSYIKTSESGYMRPEYYWVATRTKGDGNWRRGGEDNLHFQGFIYPPGVSASWINPVEKSQVVSSAPSGAEYSNAQKINARYIAQYLSARGWTLNAIAGLLGNIQSESSIFPGTEEVGGEGYGLVQWTPPSKFINWCNEQNPPKSYYDIDAQLDRINYEKTTEEPKDKQYGDPGKYDSLEEAYTYEPIVNGTLITDFEKFATSNEPPYDLACAFLYCYERPSVIIYGALPEYGYDNGKVYIKTPAETVARSLTQSQRDANRQDERDKRGENANYWYLYLSQFYFGSAAATVKDETDSEETITETLVAEEIKVSSVKLAFVLDTRTSVHYTLTKAESGKVLIENMHIPNITKGILNAITIKDLTPNTKYKVTMTVDKNTGTEHFLEYSFETPQSYPTAVSEVKLSAEQSRFPDQPFILKVSPPSDWGYWKEDARNDYGYFLYLIINGKYIAEIRNLSVSTISNLRFIPEQYFKKYSIKTGDNMQLGICAWVKDNKNKYVFDKATTKISNSICLLESSTLAYLNKLKEYK